MWVVELRPQESINELVEKSLKKDDIFDLWSLINGSTENELRDLFADWINKNVKKRMDYYNLCAIQFDINRLKNKKIDIFNEEKDKLSSLTTRMILFDSYADLIDKKIGKSIEYNDINKIEWIYDNIKIISPLKNCNYNDLNEKKVKNIGIRFILSEIRNAIMHKNYIISWWKIYIKSKDARERKTNQKDENWNTITEVQDFEAIIDADFFFQINKFCIENDRKYKASSIYRRNIDWKKWYEENKNNIVIRTVEAKEKWEIMENLMDKVKTVDPKTFSEKKLTKWQKELYSKYFTEKWNPFTQENLMFVNDCTNINEDRKPIWILCRKKYSEEDFLRFHIKENTKTFSKDSALTTIFELFTKWKVEERKIWGSNQKIEEFYEYQIWRILASPDQIYRKFKNHEAKKYIWEEKILPLAKILPKETKEEVLGAIKNFKTILIGLKKVYESSAEYLRLYLMTLYISIYMVNNPELKLSENQQREWENLWNQWRNHIINKAKNDWERYRTKESKDKWIHKILWESFRKSIAKYFTTWIKSENRLIRKDEEGIRDEVNKLIDGKTDLKFLYCIRKLSEESKKVLKENMVKQILQRKEKLEKVKIIDEDEHIRNAFAHHNYTIIPWCDHILLRDPSINDAPDREKVYNLEELYKKCLLTTYEKYLKKEEDI